ncbi:MAG: DUF1499 domain-containing protein [Desulfuromonas sp.]|nr:MAG: DUF1499 domain-containing protein [Desulfuromonas sp.]
MALLAVFGVFAFLLSGCGATKKPEIGLVDDSLRSCPDSPNCVSSMATNDAQRVGPFQLQASHEKAWALVKRTIQKLPRTRIVSSTDNYLHAECRSAVFGFTDDLELQLMPQQNQITIRSAARFGYFDFEVNRKRVEKLTSQLRAAGVIL